MSTPPATTEIAAAPEAPPAPAITTGARPARSLRWAVIGALLAGLALPAALTGIANYRAITAQAEASLQGDLARSTEVLAITLANPLWDLAPQQAESLAKALIEDPRYVSVVVRAQGMLRPFVDIQRLSGAIGEVQKLERPIVREGTTIGTVTLTMAKRPYLDHLDREIRQELLRTVGTLAVSLLLILWVMQRQLFRPMDQLTQAAEALAAGQLDSQLQVAGGGEIGRVGAAMERMRASLLAAFGSLRQHASTLEDKVDARTRELRATNLELTHTLDDLKSAQNSLVESEKLASLGRLVAGVAHELNTPLGNAITVVSTLEDQYQGMSSRISNGTGLRKSELIELLDSTRRGHDLLRRNVEKAAELVRDFKQVAVDQSSEMRRFYDLAQVIEEVLITVRPRFKHTPFAIKTRLGEGIAMDSFPGPFGQVLTNLILNALIHGFEGRSAGTVTLHSRWRADGAVEVICEDDGNGMDETVRKQIFDPFFTTKMGRGGSGLGLNIVHNIVTGLLGGRIEVSSVPGLGTRFEIVLPRAAPGEKSLTLG